MAMTNNLTEAEKQTMSNQKANDGNTLFSINGTDKGITIHLFNPRGGMFATELREADSIPKLAFAVMKAGGFTDEVVLDDDDEQIHFAWGMRRLQKGIEAQAKAKAENEKHNELEAEAFKLYRAHMRIQEPMNFTGSWDELAEETKMKWITVAEEARNIAKGEK